jgi:hypothetical protein
MSVPPSDGLILKGALTYPPGATGRSYPLAVLAHQYPATHDSYAPLIADPLAAGVATLAFDERGHGDSIVSPRGPVVVDTPEGVTLEAFGTAFVSSVAKLGFQRIEDGVVRVTSWGVFSSSPATASRWSARASAAAACCSPRRACRGSGRWPRSGPPVRSRSGRTDPSGSDRRSSAPPVSDSFSHHLRVIRSTVRPAPKPGAADSGTHAPGSFPAAGTRWPSTSPFTLAPSLATPYCSDLTRPRALYSTEPMTHGR